MIRVAFVLPHLRAGGAERCVVNWLGALDRARFAPVLMLNRVEGAFLDLLPPDVTPVAMGGARALRLPRRIGALLAAHRIDVAYAATNAMNLALLAAPAGRGTGAGRIVSEHTPPAAYLAEAKWPLLRRAAMRRAYPRADAIAVPTARIAEELAITLARPLATIVIPNPVVPSVPTPPAARDRDGALRLVSAGRLVPAKGFDTLIEACRRARDAGLAFTLAIHGEGPLEAALRTQIAAAALADRVALAGYADLAPALAAADLFVLASRREGFGNVLVEAMAAGLPVLATRAGGPETFIADGRNGFLVAPDDPAALAAALAALADAGRRRAVIPAALDTARGFTVAASTAQLEAALARVAAARSTAA